MYPRWLIPSLVSLLLLLTTFVSPFSYLPNPLGFYYQAVGGYRFDPRSPFVNRFATLGNDPTPALRARLDALLGQTGLDPLDPAQPLTGYEIRQIITQPDEVSVAEVEVHYTGTTRRYWLPAYQHGSGPGTIAGWRYTGLDRLVAPHHELPPVPLATAATPLRLGLPTRAPLAPEAHQLDTTNLSNWTASVVSDWGDRKAIRWSPDGRRFLVHARPAWAAGSVTSHRAGLWLVTLDGRPLRRLADAEGIAALDWSGDGRQIVIVRSTPQPRPATAPFTVVAVDPDSSVERDLGTTDIGAVRVVDTAAYLIRGETLWRQPLDGAPALPLGQLPHPAAAVGPGSDSLAITPDGQRIAYHCGNDLCLSDIDGSNSDRLSLGVDPPRPDPKPSADGRPGPVPTAPPLDPGARALTSLHLAWSPDGQRLAVAVGYSRPRGGELPVLFMLDRSGLVRHRLTLGVDGQVTEPRWTPDGRFIVLTTFPAGGRRIIAVDPMAGRVWDLSQPRWDAVASLTPDGQHLLLWTGRGGFWLTPLVTATR